MTKLLLGPVPTTWVELRVARQLAWLVMGSSLCSTFFGTFVGPSDTLAPSALNQQR
jgi:hypothetical protein